MIRSTCLILKSEGDSHCLPVGPKRELLRLFSQISLSDLYDFIPLHNEQGRKGLNYSLRRLWSHHYSFKHARLSLWSLSAPIQLEVMPPTLTSHRGLQSLQPVHEAEVLECVLSVHLFLKSLQSLAYECHVRDSNIEKELGIWPRIKLGNKSEIYPGIQNGRGENAQNILLNGKPYMKQPNKCTRPVTGRRLHMLLCAVLFKRLATFSIRALYTVPCLQYRDRLKGLYVVARSFFLLFLTCSACHCMGHA